MSKVFRFVFLFLFCVLVICAMSVIHAECSIVLYKHRSSIVGFVLMCNNLPIVVFTPGVKVVYWSGMFYALHTVTFLLSNSSDVKTIDNALLLSINESNVVGSVVLRPVMRRLPRGYIVYLYYHVYVLSRYNNSVSVQFFPFIAYFLGNYTLTANTTRGMVLCQSRHCKSLSLNGINAAGFVVYWPRINVTLVVPVQLQDLSLTCKHGICIAEVLGAQTVSPFSRGVRNLVLSASGVVYMFIAFNVSRKLLVHFSEFPRSTIVYLETSPVRVMEIVKVVHSGDLHYLFAGIIIGVSISVLVYVCLLRRRVRK